MSFHLEQEQAQLILDRHLSDESVAVVAVTNMTKNILFGASGVQTYLVSVAGDNKPDYVLKVYTNDKSTRRPTTYAANSIKEEYDLLVHLRTRWISSSSASKFELPTPIATTKTTDSFSYSLFSRPRGTPATFSAMNKDEKIKFDYCIGNFLRLLHQIDGEFFGRPGTPEDERQYTWQDAFVLALEEALDSVQDTVGPDFPGETIRRQLSCAIGSFLFDDVEWPSLVTITADEGSFLLSEDNNVVCTLANGLPRAVWGDPLMERLFVEPRWPLVMGYKEREGSTPEYFANGSPDKSSISESGLTILPRQNTKMLWYQLYAALIPIAEGGVLASMGDVELCMKKLETAVYY